MTEDEVVWTSERTVEGEKKQIQHTRACLDAWNKTPSAEDADDEEGLSVCEHQIWVAPHRVVDWTD